MRYLWKILLSFLSISGTIIIAILGSHFLLKDIMPNNGWLAPICMTAIIMVPIAFKILEDTNNYNR